MTQEFDRAEQDVIDTVKRVGWQVKLIISGENDDPNLPPFAYTVGLAVTFGWPELICFGLRTEYLGQVINNAVAELKSKGQVPAPGVQLDQVLERGPVRLVEFSPSLYREHLGWAIWFAASQGLTPRQFSCLQVHWPDKAGRFPDDPACDLGARECQSPTGRLQ
ncbi:DUF4262 domain-containing protein [Oleomonas cavernae]|uniref:DUF4262 domain-containing protein n=1 Tax=Oleomonas cavernae TaxID=2320859 RepID=UPI001314BF7F|nr:DUF4262 domain-containing protein [Oleomonas cavernae]